jgi:hypothetical protein
VPWAVLNTGHCAQRRPFLCLAKKNETNASNRVGCLKIYTPFHLKPQEKKEMASGSFDVFDISAWPMVTITLQRAPESDEEIAAFQNRMIGLLQIAVNGSTHIPKGAVRIMFHLDGIVGASLMQQAKAASIIQDVRPLVLQGAIQATALVATSSVARDILTFILSLAPLQSTNAVFESMADAMHWLEAQTQTQTQTHA